MFDRGTVRGFNAPVLVLTAPYAFVSEGAGKWCVRITASYLHQHVDDGRFTHDRDPLFGSLQLACLQQPGAVIGKIVFLGEPTAALVDEDEPVAEQVGDFSHRLAAAGNAAMLVSGPVPDQTGADYPARSPMIADAIAFVLRNLPAVLFVAAIAIAAVGRGDDNKAERFLSWILLLPIGVTGIWAGVFHVFFPAVAAADIGWQASPFQFEVGMADLAIGVTACASFWRDLSFKAAAVCAASIFLLGDAVGHVREMISAANFAPGNAGVPFYMDVICPLLAIGLLVLARRRDAKGRPE